MNERERDDLCWEQSLELLDLAPGELALAEQKLASAGPAALPDEQVEAIVARVTRPVRRVVPVVRRVRAAALLVGALCLAAFAVWLIWPEGQKSSEKMTYQMAIDLLEAPSQPSVDRRSAWHMTLVRVCYGIETLLSVRDDLDAPRALSESAKYELTLLRDLVSTPDLPKPVAVDQSLDLVAKVAVDPSSPTSDRVKAVVEVGAKTKSGLISMLRATGFPERDQPYLKRGMAQVRGLLER